MKSCNESEKKLIYENRAEILKGKSVKTTHAGFLALFIGIFIWMIVMFSSIFILADKLSETGFYIWILMLLVLSRFIVNFIACRIKIFQQKKSILNNADIKINGATIINVDNVNNQIFYLEDDERTPQGNPYILIYTATAGDCKNIKSGDRLAVIYGLDQNKNSSQLMKINENTKSLITNSGNWNIHEMDIGSLEVFPHKSCIYIEKEKKQVTEEKLHEIINGVNNERYIAQTRKTIKTIRILCLVILILVILAMTAINISYSFSKVRIIEYNAIAIACVGAYYLFLVFIVKQRKIKPTNYEVSEVVYYYKAIRQNAQYIAVYEWDKNLNRIKEEHYMNTCKEKANEGDILYMIQIKNGYAFIKKEEQNEL